MLFLNAVATSKSDGSWVLPETLMWSLRVKPAQTKQGLEVGME